MVMGDKQRQGPRSQVRSNGERNIIKSNVMNVVMDKSAAQKKQQAAINDAKSKKAEMHRNYGKVPKYIDKYNQERHDAHIQQMIEEEKAKIPAGTRLMPEEERIETLNDLQESRREVNTALEKLPVVPRTIAVERHKRDLEEKLVRIDRAIETFQKKLVYVAY